MARFPKFLTATAASAVVGICVIVGASPSPAAARAGGGCQTTSKALLKQNAEDRRRGKELLGDTSYTPLIRTFTPEPTSTRKFTGYETITVKSPKGTAPVVGAFALTGARRCSVIITSAQVVLTRNAYVVKLRFPGEQGNPGKLKVTLVSR